MTQQILNVAIKRKWFSLFLCLFLTSGYALAATTFYINDLRYYNGDPANSGTGAVTDVNPGDGVCATASGSCTLRAAIEEANALYVANPNKEITTITLDPNIASGMIVTRGGCGGTRNMHSDRVTVFDGCGQYHLQGKVDLDFDNRLGIRNNGDEDGTVLFINGPDITVRNFVELRGAETVVVMGPSAKNILIYNVSAIDIATINMERFLIIRPGASDIVLDGITVDDTWTSGGGMIRMEGYRAGGDPVGGMVKNVTIRNSTFRDTAGGDQVTSAIFVKGSLDYDQFATNAVAVDGLTIANNQFIDFTHNGNGTTGAQAMGPIALWGKVTSLNINSNVIKSGTSDSNLRAAYGIRIADPDTTGVIQYNSISGSNAGVVFAPYDHHNANTFPSAALNVKLYKNAFSNIHNLNRGGSVLDGQVLLGQAVHINAAYGVMIEKNVASDIEASSAALNTNFGQGAYGLRKGANQGILSPQVSRATFDGAPQCSVSVEYSLDGAGGGVGGPYTLEAYWNPPTTPAGAREGALYLGSQQVSADGTQIFPYSVGPGFLTLTATDAAGNTSNFSSPVAVENMSSDTCRPYVTINQNTSQADPTYSGTPIRFLVEFSEPIDSATFINTSINSSLSIATGVTIQSIVELGPYNQTAYMVNASAKGAGDVILDIPTDAVRDTAGNGNFISTSTDNKVTYLSPVTLSPLMGSISEGQGFDVEIRLAKINDQVALLPKADVTYVMTASDGTQICIVDPSDTICKPSVSLSYPASTSLDNFNLTLRARHDAIVEGNQSHTVHVTTSSTDESYNALDLSLITVQVSDVRASLIASPTIVLANGSSTASIVVQAHNTSGNPIATAGASVVLTTSLGRFTGDVTTISGVTDANGRFATVLSSAVSGQASITAKINGLEAELISPSLAYPALVTFSAITVDLNNVATKLIATPLSVAADGVTASTITVHAADNSGNPVAGVAVVITTDRGDLATATGVTDSLGNYTTDLTSTSAGVAKLNATLAGSAVVHGADTQVTFVSDAIDNGSKGTLISLSGSTSVIANGIDTATITVQLRDILGNNLAQAGIPIAITSSFGTLLPQGSGVTDVNGRYSVTLHSNTAGQASVNAIANGKGVINGAPLFIDFVPSSTGTKAVTSMSSLGLLIMVLGIGFIRRWKK